MARGFQSVDTGHGDVQQYHVRLVLGASLQGAHAVLGLGHHFHAGLFGQQCAQALAGQRFVVGNDHLHGTGFLTFERQGRPRRW